MASLNQLINQGHFSLDLVEEQYARYKKDPSSVAASWRDLFDQLEQQPPTQEAAAAVSQLPSQPALLPEEIAGKSVLYYPHVEVQLSGKECRIPHLIHSYRTYGYLMADCNPIAEEKQEEPDQLKLEHLGFTRQDLALPVPTHQLLDTETAPLLELINTLRSIYCDKIGIEYMELHNPQMEQWLQERIEPTKSRKHLTNEQKQQILHHLNKSELFESFLHTRFTGQKRFSLEGAETLIPMLAEMINRGAQEGIEEFIFGMAHRGRLNVLCNIFDKTYAEIFSEFEEGHLPQSVEGSGDVKYHKGFYSEVKSIQEHQVKLTLVPNPSHLESVDPVVLGQARARQFLLGDEAQRAKVLPVLIHGDAALSGQGIIYETMQFNRLRGYETGGTIHLVINNQIGFTTLPKDGRSTRFCTDIARTFDAPVFHLNAEDPEGAVFAMELAVSLRQAFHIDVFLELNCYRKYGHNESDEPSFTQPLIYQMIKKKHPIRELYRDALVEQGVMEQAVVDEMEAAFKKDLHDSHQLQKKEQGLPESGEQNESRVLKREELFPRIETGVPKEVLLQVAAQLCRVPEGFHIHSKLAALNRERLEMVQEQQSKQEPKQQLRPIDWGMAELLSYGTLLHEGCHVRLSGQDSCRGTFTHRHACFIDQQDQSEYTPLQNLKEGQGRFEIYNSPLSEYAVLGFEFGYSVADVESLVLWEAQFGDFCNAAQVVIDQYIAASEQKWNQHSPLVLLLPHGYEGQGPEHSSARVERFLTLAGDNNMKIANPTTPAQLFHLLRRQVLNPVKKPLVVFTPKGLLRHPACVSSLDDLTHGSFQEILDDPAPPAAVQQLALCSGRIFYDVLAERSQHAMSDLAIVRIEQIYPLDVGRIKQLMEKYGSMKRLVWVQEEPANMGAWNFIRPILRELLPQGIVLAYAGRQRSASPAVGSHAVHKKEHAAIMNVLFDLGEKR